MENNSTITRLLPTVLSQDEVVKRAERMAQLMTDIESLTEQAKAASAGIKSKISMAKKEMSQLGHTVATGKEEREVECRTDRDWDHKEIVVTRLDTNEEIERRTMTMSEAQTDLLDRGAAPGKLIAIDGGCGAAEPSEGGDPQAATMTEEESQNLAQLQQEVNAEAGGAVEEDGEDEAEGEPTVEAEVQEAPEVQGPVEAPEPVAAQEEAPAEEPKPTSRRGKRNAS